MGCVVVHFFAQRFAVRLTCSSLHLVVVGKHTAYYRTNHVPLIFVPSWSSSSSSSSSSGVSALVSGGPSRAYAELTDVYPTLAQLAGIPVPPTCADANASASSAACVEGHSLAPLVLGDRQAKAAFVGKKASFWQWSKMMIEKQPVMGYAMATTTADGTDVRYTEWVGYDFKRFEANFSEVHGVELYNLTSDLQESTNLAVTRAGDPVIEQLRQQLHAQLIAGWRAALPPAQ